MDRDAAIEEIRVVWPHIWEAFMAKLHKYGHTTYKVVEEVGQSTPYWIVNKNEALIMIPPDYYENERIER